MVMISVVFIITIKAMKSEDNPLTTLGDNDPYAN